MYAFSSVLAALYRRLATGRGAEIQISMLEALTEWAMPAAYVQRYTGAPPERAGELILAARKHWFEQGQLA